MGTVVYAAVIFDRLISGAVVVAEEDIYRRWATRGVDSGQNFCCGDLGNYEDISDVRI